MARVPELTIDDVAKEHREDFAKFQELFKSFGNQVNIFDKFQSSYYSLALFFVHRHLLRLITSQTNDPFARPYSYL